MRATLADASLARYAGQFVWLELNFDKAENQAFFSGHAVLSTPTFFVIDSAAERVTATQLGAMTLEEVTQFLDRGSRGAFTKAATPADASLARGDVLLALNQPADAATAYRQAL